MSLTFELPPGWHDLNIEDRLRSLLDHIGLPASEEQITKAVEDLKAND